MKNGENVLIYHNKHRSNTSKNPAKVIILHYPHPCLTKSSSLAHRHMALVCRNKKRDPPYHPLQNFRQVLTFCDKWDQWLSSISTYLQEKRKRSRRTHHPSSNHLQFRGQKHGQGKLRHQSATSRSAQTYLFSISKKRSPKGLGGGGVGWEGGTGERKSGWRLEHMTGGKRGI